MRIAPFRIAVLILTALLGATVSAGPAAAAAAPASTASATAPSDTGWQPDGPYGDFDIPACGTTVTVTEKINKVERRTLKDGRGNTVDLFRGRYVVKLSAPNGTSAKLDNSGPYSIVTKANGNELITVLGPAFIFPQSDAEPAAFRRAGLPEAFYYTRGVLTLAVTGYTERVVTRPADPVDICRLLK